MVQHQEKEIQENPSKEWNTDRLIVHYYTDPLCCWSWAFEKTWQQFQDEFGDKISVQYILCGMIPDWKTYNDPMNNVSPAIERQYLYKVREAVMVRKMNIARDEVLRALAHELAETNTDFNVLKFENDLKQGSGKAAFRSDLQNAAFHKIGRYPTLTMTPPKGDAIIMVGYRPYGALREAVSRFSL